MLKIFFASILSFGFAACVTVIQPGMESNLITQSEYESVLDKSTKNIEVYNGLYNTMNLTATLVRSQLAEAQLKQNARLFQWEAAKFQDEHTKKMDAMKAKTEVFVSFYTPDKKNDDLQKSQTLWKIFLDSGGHRYEGKATKIKLQLAEVQGNYPYHTRFSTPYLISFPITTQSLEGQEVKLVITGSVGSASLTF